MRLYGYWRSSATWRVRIALAWKGLKYEYEPIHLANGVQNSDEYMAKNPTRTVPLLEWDDGSGLRRLSQSMAILEFLEETHPQPALLPKDPFGRAEARKLAEVVNSGIQPLQNLSVLQRIKNELKGDDKAWAAYWIARGLSAFEALVKDTAGAYCVRDEVSYADLCLVPQLYNARRFGCDMKLFPTCVEIEQNCNKLQAFQVAAPDVQPDAQK